MAGNSNSLFEASWTMAEPSMMETDDSAMETDDSAMETDDSTEGDYDTENRGSQYRCSSRNRDATS